MYFHSTVVFVKDIEKSKEFYTKFLGFSIIHNFGKNIILNDGLTLWEIRPDHIISTKLQTRNDANRFELYFEHDEIEKVFNDLEKAGVTFLHKIHEEPWGQRTFRFFDPDDHLIEIGEPLEVFVENLFKKGMNNNDISKKTGIPIETVIKLLQHDK
jgi:catechol 2,3-dioxygenase-like lactoylglutathione lyase family enzyme